MDHGWEEQGGQDVTDQMDHRVPGDPPPGEVATEREDDAHRGVEVGPGHLPMGRMMAMTIIPGATTAAVRPTVPGKAFAIIPPPAATNTSRNVPKSSAHSRRHS